MKKRAVSFLLLVALYYIAFAFVFQIEPTNAATTATITMTEGDVRTITIPKKQKYYTSSESNQCIASSAKYKSRKVKISALKPGTATLEITSTKNKTYTYVITVVAKPKDNNVEEPQEIAGGCPHCKKKGCLQTAQTTYARNPIKTGYLKEPLISGCEFRRMHFSDKLTENEIQNLVKSWNGVILSKFRDSSGIGGYSNFAYDVVVPCEYSGLNKTSVYEQGLEQKYKLNHFGCVDSGSLGDNTDNYSHYLTEWTIEEVIAEPAKKVTVNTNVIECTNCGYKFVK